MKAIHHTSETSGHPIGPIRFPESLRSWFGTEELVKMVMDECLPAKAVKFQQPDPSSTGNRWEQQQKSTHRPASINGTSFVPAVFVYALATGHYSSIDVAENRNNDAGIAAFLAIANITEIELRRFRRGFRKHLTEMLSRCLVKATTARLSQMNHSQFRGLAVLPQDFRVTLEQIALNRVQKSVVMDHVLLDY